jgi:DNA polymerase I-like protein with 3'-5' exonuclease and polymerase domains
MSQIKECFTSRFPGGSIVEMDYGQLEVVGLAILSGSSRLKADLKSGIDMHCQNALDLFPKHLHDYDAWVKRYQAGDPETCKLRKIAKVFSFQLQYGAGAASMAEDQGVEKKLAQKFIDNYYARYPRVKEWQDENIEAVKQYAEPSGKYTEGRVPANKGYLHSPTGRTYEFTEYDAPEFMREKGILTSFSPTQIKNYPVQGFSTGDLVPLAVGKVMRYLIKYGLEDRILLINTIHDSILFDVPSFDDFGKAIIKGIVLNLYGVLRNLRAVLMSIYHDILVLWPDIDFDIPLHVDVETGNNWGNMKSLYLEGV